MCCVSLGRGLSLASRPRGEGVLGAAEVEASPPWEGLRGSCEAAAAGAGRLSVCLVTVLGDGDDMESQVHKHHQTTSI